MELVLELARKEPIVFATGRDVASYYERFCPSHPEIVFTQRDYLAGTRIMDKPINSGPSIGMEMEDYKAVFAHQETLPYYHYDYTETWTFRADDTSHRGIMRNRTGKPSGSPATERGWWRRFRKR